MDITQELLRKLIDAIAATSEDEIDCDEWLERVGRLLEIKAAGAPVPDELQPVMQHIDVCPSCADEFRLLLAAMQG